MEPLQEPRTPRLVLLLSILLIFTAAPGVGQASSEPMMLIDGQEVPLSSPPIQAGDCLLVPLRPILEEMGASNLEWNPAEAKITWQWAGERYELQIDNTLVQCGGEEIELSHAPLLFEGYTQVPANFLGEIFQFSAKWDSHSRQFEVTSRGGRKQELVAEGLEKGRQIVDTALKYQGVPYRWGGTGPGGFDCSGFIWYVFRENGIQLPRVSSEIYELGEAVAREDLLPGDLVFFTGYRPGPSHGTIYIGDGEFIHSPSEGYCVSIARIDEPEYWAPRYYGARRIRE